MAGISNDEDEVIEEIPVYLSKNLQESLYLFQYPTKVQNNNAFDNSEIINCCVKPVSHEVKLDFALNTESLYYDSFKGQKFAVAADGKYQLKNDRPTFKRGIVDKQTFASTKSMESIEKYAVGIYQDNEIHLTPLTSIHLVRPQVSYFDKQDKRAKAEQKALNEEDEDEELQQVTVKFARNGPVSKKAQMKKKVVDEPWCETYWHPSSSPTAELERQKLFTTNHQISQALAQGSEKYKEKLLPRGGISIETILPPRVLSICRLRPMSLPDQVKNILKEGKMLTFDELVCILQDQVDKNVTDEKVLRILPQVGLLINGNWVAQSEVIYPPETFSKINGIPAEVMARARDYIIFRFSRASYLYRRQVFLATQLPEDESMEVLESVAHLNAEKKWELLLPPNKDFEQRYPELVQRQEIVWRATEQTYLEMDYEKSPKRVRKRSVRDAKIVPPPTNLLQPPQPEIPATTNTT